MLKFYGITTLNLVFLKKYRPVDQQSQKINQSIKIKVLLNNSYHHQVVKLTFSGLANL